MTLKELLFERLVEIATSQIEPLFTTGVEVTIIVRQPDNDEGDVLVSTDSIDNLRRLLDRSERREIF